MLCLDYNSLLQDILSFDPWCGLVFVYSFCAVTPSYYFSYYYDEDNQFIFAMLCISIFIIWIYILTSANAVLYLSYSLRQNRLRLQITWRSNMFNYALEAGENSVVLIKFLSIHPNEVIKLLIEEYSFKKFYLIFV